MGHHPDEVRTVGRTGVAGEDFGNRISYWHGVDIQISGRMRNSLMFQGGTSTGRAVTDKCDVTPKLDSPSQRFCRMVAPFTTQFKGLMRTPSRRWTSR